MKLFVVGLNHNTAPIDVREKLSFSRHRIVEADSSLKEHASIEEGLILSTCNRMEVYAVGNGCKIDYISRVKSFLSEFHNTRLSDFESRLYIYENEETVRHIFKVASGLDSMVLGEVEILGQVKKAYQAALEAGTAGRVLNRLLQNTFNTAKRVRTDTFVARGPVSAGSVAIRLAKNVLGDLKGKKALVIGTGKTGEQVMQHLKKNGLEFILVSNRTFQKAQVLADMFGAYAVRFDNFSAVLQEADVVITSTSAPHYIVHKCHILDVMPRRNQKPLFIIDLAVPRNVDPEVKSIDSVYLYDIDDLKKIADENIALRKNELDNCQRIIDESCRKFLKMNLLSAHGRVS